MPVAIAVVHVPERGEEAEQLPRLAVHVADHVEALLHRRVVLDRRSHPHPFPCGFPVPRRYATKRFS